MVQNACPKQGRESYIPMRLETAQLPTDLSSVTRSHWGAPATTSDSVSRAGGGNSAVSGESSSELSAVDIRLVVVPDDSKDRLDPMAESRYDLVLRQYD